MVQVRVTPIVNPMNGVVQSDEYQEVHRSEINQQEATPPGQTMGRKSIIIMKGKMQTAYLINKLGDLNDKVSMCSTRG